MARESDPESRPISVAEILARGRADAEAAARGGAPAPSDPTDSDDDAGGRRRRGGSGSLSVSDLTGQVPRSSDRPGTHSGRFPAQPASPLPPAFDPTPAPSVQPPRSFHPAPEVGSAGASTAPASTPPASTPPVSNPATGGYSTDFGPVGAAVPFPRADPPLPTDEPDALLPSEPPVRRDTSTHRDVPVRGDLQPGWTEQPATRDINRGAIAERFRQTDAEERTGIIPRYDTPADRTVADDARPLVDVPDLDRLSPEEREREFERYRNFEDIPAEPDPAPASGRLFGRLRSLLRSDDSSPDEGTEPGSAPDPAGTPAWNRAPQPDLGPDETFPTDPQGRFAAGGAGVGLHDQLRDSSDFDFARPATPDRANPDRPTPDRATDKPAAADASPWSKENATRTVGRPDTSSTVGWSDTPSTVGWSDSGGDPDTEVVDLDRAHLGPYGDTGHDSGGPDTAVTQPVRAAGPGVSVRRERVGARAGGDEASPGRQWAVLGAQVGVGLLLGVGLFLGFAELWRWNVYFALVLSAVVIFGLVTTVHVVRRSQDLISTLLALGVGLIVTIGPLVLLAAGG
ncbi:hypothetical protein [Williamsia sp. CHRR-6]|uniref:hypothetical protein n=1 Tax=Williamsia sp. CHRR-6 TaxID=2835871 RepID=UPI001BDB215C|nr:hypothetical protein [Williamsia sp. CHRR-6]MBT0565991.1 hypothetical protein [Williamsia sp. CHRR-6]